MKDIYGIKNQYGEFVKCRSCDEKAIITYPHSTENTPYCQIHFNMEKERSDNNNRSNHVSYYSSSLRADRAWEETERIFKDVTRIANSFRLF